MRQRQSTPASKPATNVVGERLRKFRLDKDLTYRELAGLIGGVLPVTLWRAERGRALQDRTISKIERFLGGVSRA